jgi:integrase/recombinase XerC
MIRLGKMQTNPMLKIVSPKTAKKLPVYIQAEKMDNLLDRVAWKDDFEGIRNHLIIELFYTSGMRLAELMSLTAASINFNQKQLKVLGKRNKERIIPILPEMAEHIKKYTQLRNALNPDTDFLFVMENGKALYRSAIYRLVNKELGQVTSQEKRSPHVLRHSFATEMLNNGADLNAIKEILGHANLQATQVYTHNTIEKLKKAYTKAHPRA